MTDNIVFHFFFSKKLIIIRQQVTLLQHSFLEYLRVFRVFIFYLRVDNDKYQNLQNKIR